jgi:hypothetical protein
MVAEDMGVKAIGYTHKQVAAQMKALGRNYSFHWENNGQMQCRMFVLGFLTTSAGKVPACVVKFFDRQLPNQRTRITKHYLGRLYNGCYLWWIFIRLPPQGEGSNNDEEVNRVVFRDIVLPVIEAEKLEYVRERKRLQKVQEARAAAAAGLVSPPRGSSQVSQGAATVASHISESSARSHSGLRTGLPPGTHSPEELFIRREDNPAFNGVGIAFAKRREEEDEDSDDDRGSEGEALDIHITDAEVDLLPLNPPPPPNAAAEDLTGAMPPSVPWVAPLTEDMAIRPLSEIQRLLQQELAGFADSFAIRFALGTDGASPQMGSMMGMPGHCSNPNGVIHDYLAPAGNDCAKGPSSCSSFSNANDAGRCHCQLKDYVKRFLCRKPQYTSPLMEDFLLCIVPTLGLDPATVRTINYFCGHLEDMICKVWTPSNVKSGYIKAGLLANTASGIDIDVILGHWIGMAEIPQTNYEIIRSAIPLFTDEALANTCVSDASMAFLEKYFPRPFKLSKVDRALSSWCRMRAAILVADQSKHLRNKRIISAVVVPTGGQDEESVNPPLSHGYVLEMDKKKKEMVMMRVCGCRAVAFKNARLYPNTAEGWKNHKKSKPHQNWLASNRRTEAIQPAHSDAAAASDGAAVASSKFSDHPFASQENCRFLATIAENYCLSFDVAARFSQHGFNDEDITVLAHMRPELYYSILGMTHANAVGFAQACAIELGFFSDHVSDDEDEHFQGDAEEQNGE